MSPAILTALVTAPPPRPLPPEPDPVPFPCPPAPVPLPASRAPDELSGPLADTGGAAVGLAIGSFGLGDAASRGTAFFPGFNDPTMAQSLEVIDFDEETATAHPFKVQVQNGLWSIPSHYNYPADAEQQLSQISAAIIALRKDVVAADNVCLLYTSDAADE